MSWDESLFGWMWRTSRSWLAPREAPEVIARRVALAPLVDRLRAVAVGVAGRPVVLRAAEAEGGVAIDAILLPAHLDFAASLEENEDAFVLRTALAAAMLRSGLVPSHAALSPSERTLATLLAVVRARAWLADELPASDERLAAASARLAVARAGAATPLERLVRSVLAGEAADPIAQAVLATTAASADALVAEARGHALALGHAPPVAPVPLWGWLACGEPGAALDGAPNDPRALPTGTERTIRTRDRITRKHLDPRPLTENPLVHSFEKVHTLEEHVGGKKQLDGSDELEAHADALEELDLREVVRSNEETRSLLRSDAMFDGGAPDMAADETSGGVPYDEWNEAQRTFRDAWCRVHVRAVEERVDPATAEAVCAATARSVQPHVDAVRAELARLALARRPRARQLDGPDVDDDAMVDRHAALLARATPPDRLYRSTRRHSPDLAVLLLVDASLSTDGWIEGQRVLDVERDATMVLAEALEGWVDELGVAAFASHTRSDCRFVVVKGVQERWREVRRRLTSLEPAGYTRIGPAIRHGTAVLERCAARRRLLLVVTDGKPNDYDRYEGRYGVADVAHAVLEASAHGVHVHALAIDREARHHLPAMFRAGSYSLLRHPRELAPAMGQVVASMQR